MHKITKGLKKKKKGKKNKHKEEELFDAAELAAYRLEHQAVPAAPGDEPGEGEQGEATEPAAENDEWQRFKALTAGVDSVLKKTQGDLNRIKSTSFFQRKAPVATSTPSSGTAVPATHVVHARQQETQHKEQRWVGFEEGSRIDEPPPEPRVEVEEAAALPEPEPELEESEEEEEEEQDDDLFDTSYVDVVTSGDIKLAYIPDSPIEEPSDYDPFDTSIVEKVIKPDVDKRGKKLVSLGCAVDVLTGILDNEKVLNAVIPTAGKKRRVIPKNDLLLGSFDEGNSDSFDSVAESVAVKSLLDDDAPLGSSNFVQVESVPLEQSHDIEKVEPRENFKDLVAEFDLISDNQSILPQPEFEFEKEVDGDIEDEFAALAAESLTKKGIEDFDDPFNTSAASVILGAPDILSNTLSSFVHSPDVDIVLNKNHPWAEFEETKPPKRPGPPRPAPIRPVQPHNFSDHAIAALAKDLDIEPLGSDPFDTSFAENILPGKVELRLIESEILYSDKDLEINEARILSRSDSDFDFDPRAGETEIQSSVSIHITDPAGERQQEIRSLHPSHRDLLGGSTTDLSKICHEPIEPAADDDGDLGYSDPFDTTVVDILVAPGKAELKFLEKELLGDEQHSTLKRTLSDEDFDPRGDEDFDPRKEELSRRESIAERPSLLDVNKTHKVVAFDLPTPSARPDLLVVGHEEGAKISKPLTPFYVERKRDPFLNSEDQDPEEETDPFDTTFASNIPPGKAELKLIESEFVGGDLKDSLSDQDFNPRDDNTVSPVDKVTNLGRRFSECPQQPTGNLGRRFSDFTGDRKRTPPRSLNIKSFVIPTVPEVPPIPSASPPKPDLLVTHHEEFDAKPLTPAVEERIDYCDPFDTSIASNLVPGRAELKVLEEELISETGETSLKRSYTDPDFNPRDEIHEKEVVGEKPDLLNLPSSPGARVLTPFVGCSPIDDVNFDDIDPFDTSIVGDLIPGRAELRILESELFGQ